jgi:peptidyl-prolyl cis-trans isomerase C
LTPANHDRGRSAGGRSFGASRAAAVLARWPEARAFALGLALAAGVVAVFRAGGPSPGAASDPSTGVATDDRPTIEISPVSLARLRSAREREAGVAPRSAAAERALREDAIDEEVLYREALAHAEADRSDPAIRRRLVVLASELAAGGIGEGFDLEADARRLGLDRNDVVLRRYLIESMRLALSRPGPSDAPSEAEIERAYRRDAARYTAPERLVLTQIYLSRERHGAATEADAAELLERLRHDGLGADAAAHLGDPFTRGAEARGTLPELERSFGAGFAHALEELPLRAWAGPVASAYGLHLVWIRERAPGHLLPLDQVRGQVMQQLLQEREKDLLRTRLATLRARYRIELPDQTGR